MVKMMQEMQPDRFKVALHSVDILKMTPLHRAVLFDHVEVVKYLVEQVFIFSFSLAFGTSAVQQVN